MLNYISDLVWYPEPLRTSYVESAKVLRNSYGATTYLPIKLLVSGLEQHRIANHSLLLIFQITEVETARS